MMRISASCRPNPGSPGPGLRRCRRDAGFTLIEILVVLVMVGLLAGVALPRLANVARQYELASNRQALIVDLGNLPYKAYVTGQAFQLSPLVPGTITTTPPAWSSSGAAPLLVPDGWKVTPDRTILYAFDGVCSGGTVTLASPDGTIERVTLAPPACRPSTGVAAR